MSVIRICLTIVCCIGIFTPNLSDAQVAQASNSLTTIDEPNPLAQLGLASTKTVDITRDDIKLAWTQYKTNNFVIYTDVSETQANALIEELETFAASLAQLVKMPAHATLPKLTVFNFADKDLYSHFGEPLKAQGYYFKDIDGPVIAIGPERDGQSFDLTTMYHEYVHFFTRAVSNARQPVWYSEGLADFFSTLNIDGDTVRVGATPLTRFNTLKRNDLLDLANLFNMLEYDDSIFINTRFYASAWLVTHFMMLSERNGFPNYTVSMDKMLALQQQGIKGEDAFTQAFDISLSEFKSQLSEYARKRSLNGVSIPKPELNIAIMRTPVPPQNIATLLSIVGRYHPPLFSKLLGLGMEENDPLAYARLSELLSRQSLTSEVVPPLLDFLGLKDITGPMTHDFLGQTYVNLLDIKAKQKTNKDAAYRQQMKEWMQLAYTHFSLAHAEKPSELNLKGLTRLAWQKKEREEALKYANALYQLQNTDIDTNYFVGEFMFRSGNKAFATFLLNNVVNWSDAHTSFREKAQSLLERIEKS